MKYQQTKLNINDRARLTDTFLLEGREYFGNSFCKPKNRNHQFNIINIIYGKGQKDGHGDFVKDVIIVELNGYNPKNWVKLDNKCAQICADFLEKIN